MANPNRINAGIATLCLLATLLIALLAVGGCLSRSSTETPPRETAATGKGGRLLPADPFHLLAGKIAVKQWGDFSLPGLALMGIAATVRLLSGSWRSAGSSAALGIVGTVAASFLTDCAALGLLAPGGQVIAIVSRKFRALKKLWKDD